jgi:hypothetical protein
MMKRGIVNLGSRYVDGALMYPGYWCLTWVRTSLGVWALVSMERAP